MSRWLNCLAWVVVSLACHASAQPAYTPPTCLPLLQAGAQIGCVKRFTMQSGDFVISCIGINCTATLDTTVTKLGPTIGESTDFGSEVNMSSSYLVLGDTNPADSGNLRFDNADTGLCWETATPGTDKCVTVSASDYLTFDDVHIGANTVYGGSGSGENMTIASTSHGTKGTVTLDSPVAVYPSIPDDVGTKNFIEIAPTFQDTGTANDTLTYGLLFNPTFTGSSSGTTGGNQLGAVKASGAYALNATGVVTPTFISYLFYDNRQISTARTNISADVARTIYADASITQTGDAGSWGEQTGFYNGQSAKVSGAVSATFNNLYGFVDAPIITTNDGGGTITVTTRTGAQISNPALSGSGIETLTNNYGINIAAQTAGTNIFPLAIGAHTITGTVPSNVGVFGVESGLPDRAYFKNESGHIWRTGWSAWSMSSALLGADNGTDYFRPVGLAQAAGATEASLDDVPPPGPMKVYGISCNARVAPANGAGTQTRTCTLKVGTPGSMSASALTCSFTEATQSCTDREEAGVAIGATQVATIEWTAGSTPADTEVAVTLWWNLDAF